MTDWTTKESCGCGAFIYKAQGLSDDQLLTFRETHRHIEPRTEIRVVSVPRGAPRLRAGRTFRRRKAGPWSPAHEASDT